MPSWLLPPFATSPLLQPALCFLLATLVAGAGPVLLSKREGWWPVLAVAGVLAGWALLLPAPRAWVGPRGVLEHLPGSAAACLLGAAAAAPLAGRLRGAVALAGLFLAAGWLAGAPAARGEFWRVLFAVGAATVLLRFRGGATAAGLATAASTLLLGTLTTGAGPAWWAAAATLLGAAGAVATFRPGTVLAAAPVALGIVATALGTGGLPRGRVEPIDLACAAALLAPRLRGPIERRMARKPGARHRLMAGTLAALVPALLCWAGGLLLRR